MGKKGIRRLKFPSVKQVGDWVRSACLAVVEILSTEVSFKKRSLFSKHVKLQTPLDLLANKIDKNEMFPEVEQGNLQDKHTPKYENDWYRERQVVGGEVLYYEADRKTSVDEAAQKEKYLKKIDTKITNLVKTAVKNNKKFQDLKKTDPEAYKAAIQKLRYQLQGLIQQGLFSRYADEDVDYYNPYPGCKYVTESGEHQNTLLISLKKTYFDLRIQDGKIILTGVNCVKVCPEEDPELGILGYDAQVVEVAIDSSKLDPNTSLTENREAAVLKNGWIGFHDLSHFPGAVYPYQKQDEIIEANRKSGNKDAAAAQVSVQGSDSPSIDESQQQNPLQKQELLQSDE
jgi:hypothetical protein